MIKFFRTIRRSLINQNKMKKYFKYAIGEILLVVIGILIALQINNWNEDAKTQKTTHYVLQEILNNLKEDSNILEGIVLQREKARASVANMIGYLNQPQINQDTLVIDMLNFLTFERYFSINNGYEMFKSKGLELSNNELTTKVSRYYNYEQMKINRSIYDVEKAIIAVLEDQQGIVRFIETLDLREKLKLTNYNDPNLKKELHNEVTGFKNNNSGTIKSINTFLKFNAELISDIEQELKTYD